MDLIITDVHEMIPSPDGSQILILQNNGTKSTLILSDLDGRNKKVIEEGLEIGGVSWSLDQRMIAFYMSDNKNGGINKGVYIFDTLVDESIQVVDDIEYSMTSWSPSGEKLVYTELIEGRYNSSIVYLRIRNDK